jgi:hypothetical protein
MRVIKVVHSSAPEERELEQALSAIQTFDVDGFLERHETQIMEYSKDFETPEEETDAVPSGFRASRLASRLAKSSLQGIKTAASIREYCIERAMKETAWLLLQDLRTKLENLEAISLETARTRYPNTHNLSIGTFTLHPCDPQRLTQLEHFHRNLALEKDDELIDLLGNMGADTVRIIERDEDAMVATGGAGVEVQPIVVGPQLDLTLSKRISSNRELLVVYEGTDVEIDPTLLAKSLWFTNDSQLNAIFQSRRSGNPIREYTLRSTYTQTFDFDFELAAGFLSVSLDLKAEYETLKTTERFFHVDFG